MKKTLIFGLVSILLLPLLAVGCGEKAKTIEISLDEFMAQNNIVKSIELTYPGSLAVRLGVNPTTGYNWGEIEVSNMAIIVQASYQYEAPEDTDLVGAGGTSVWVFDTKGTGTATIKLSYGQPWEGGEKDTFTLTINVTVK